MPRFPTLLAWTLAVVLLAVGLFFWWRREDSTAKQPDAAAKIVPAEKKLPVVEKPPPAKQEPAIPANYWRLPVRNICTNDIYTLGYYDQDKDIIYQWKSVTLDEKNVPNLGPFNRSPLLDAEKSPVIPVDPPVHYLFDKMNVGRVGYLDRSHTIFYQWKGIEVKREERLPADKDGKHAEAVYRDHYFRVVEVDPPKHQLDHPERWKKIPK